MKKSLLVISVILLIAGLFISCNSEAAEPGNGLAEVKFADNAKALSSSIVMHNGDPLPVVEYQYWWYRATKTTPGGTTGARSNWTRVKSDVGLANTSVGRFSLGDWRFDLIAVASADSNPNTFDTVPSYSGSAWSGTSALVYWGSANASLTTLSQTVNVVLSANTSGTTVGTVQLGKVVFLNNTIGDGNTTWSYVVKLDGEVLEGLTGTITMTAGEKAINSDETTTTQVSEQVSEGAHSVTIEVYDKSSPSVSGAFVMYSATKQFVMFPGAVVTIKGNLEEAALSGDVTFTGDITQIQQPTDYESYEAYIYNGTTTTLKSAFADALSEAQNGNTVGLLKDVTVSQHTPVLAEGYASAVVIDKKSITIEGNGHKVSSSIEVTDPNKQFGIVVLGGESINSAYVTVHINNLVCDFTGFGYGIEALNKVKCYVDNCTINTDGIGVSANGEAVSINSVYYAWPENAEVYVSNSNITSRSLMLSNEDYKNSALFAAYGGKTVATNCDLNAKYAIGFGNSGATVEYISGTITYAHDETVETAKLCMYQPDSCYYHCTADGQAKDDNNPLDCTIIMHEDYADYYSNSDLTNNVVFKSGHGTASVDGEVLTISVAKN